MLCGLVFILDGFDAQCIGFLAPPISETLGSPLKNFGPVFAAGLIGLMIAAMAVGPVADHWGRKWPLVAATLAFASFTLLTARITSMNELLVLRFLTGLGLGGAMPNGVALSSEYAPRRLQAAIVAMLFCGMPGGALVASLASSAIIPMWGWRPVFYLGGILPFVLSIALIAALPESVRFLSLSRPDPQKAARILAKISPELAGSDFKISVPRVHRPRGLLVKRLFTEGRALGTILLWIPFFMSLLIIYFIVNWLPGLLRQSGMPVSAGVTAISLFSLGGIVGSLLEGRLMDRFGIYAGLLSEFGLSVLLIGALAFSATSLPVMGAVTFVLGITVQGAQAGLNALSAIFYPTSIRSTGVGWALGVGRIGSIVGPLLGGVLLRMGWTPRQILVGGIVPSSLAAVAILLSGRFQRSAVRSRAEAEQAQA